MGVYTHVLFDLDGTLTDSGPGITNGFAYAISEMGGDVPDVGELRRFIGPPLEDSFGRLLGYSPTDVERAVALYRRYYNEMGGALENAVYPGVFELLRRLRDEGLILAVATSKAAAATQTVLSHFGLRECFDLVVCGDREIRPTKADVIRDALAELGVLDLTCAVMVGDREQDVMAAREVGVDSIGVLWGYGDETELTSAGATFLAKAPHDVLSLVEQGTGFPFHRQGAVERKTRPLFHVIGGCLKCPGDSG